MDLRLLLTVCAIMTPPLIADNHVRTFQEHTSGQTSIRRSILGGLNPAVRALLRNAKEVPSKNTKYRTFVTIGTERDHSWESYRFSHRKPLVLYARNSLAALHNFDK